MLPQGPVAGVGPLGGQDAGAEAGRPPLDPTSPMPPGITVYCCPSGTSRAPGGPERLGGQGVGPAPETQWLLAQLLSSDPIGSSQATWKTLEGGWWTVPVSAPPLSTGPPTSPGCWRWGVGCMAQRPLYVMNHSSTLGGDMAMGLSRKEKHPPDSHVPQPQETTALERVVGEQRVGAPGELLGLGDCTRPGSWETDSHLPCDPGVSNSFLWASVSPSIKEGNDAQCPPATKSPSDLSPSWGDPRPAPGGFRSIPAPGSFAPKPVPSPRAPEPTPSFGFLACPLAPPSTHTPAESLGSTVETTGFSISV